MADLFLHLCFARRLRLTDGLHPLAGEALARRPSLVALGATLPLLPAVELAGMSFFRRLFSGGDATRWQKQLAPAGAPRARYLAALLSGGEGHAELGSMARLSLALGALSHELLEASLAGSAQGDKAGVERAQARLWVQENVPSADDQHLELHAEWRATSDLTDTDLHRRTFEHIDAALKTSMSSAPGKDTLSRWARGLALQAANVDSHGLPPSLGVADHTARGPHYEQGNFLAGVKAATEWFVVVANRLAEQAGRDEGLSPEGVARALGDGAVVDKSAESPSPASWTTWYNGTRTRLLERGRNPQPAFIEGVGEVKKIDRSAAFTGMLRLGDLPADLAPSEVPPDLQGSLPPTAAPGPTDAAPADAAPAPSEAPPPAPAESEPASSEPAVAAPQAAYQPADLPPPPPPSAPAPPAAVASVGPDSGAPVAVSSSTSSQDIAPVRLAPPPQTTPGEGDLQEVSPSQVEELPVEDPPRE